MGFFSELKRRHVVQVGIAYLVVAWGAAQVAELVLDTFDTPGWVMQAILVTLGLGVPVALVLAWICDLRADGLHKESESVAVDGQAPATGALEKVVEHESIAVLPFVNMSSDPEQEYFSDGISEELLNLLARIPELRVSARTSAFSFKGKDVEIPEIARRLQVVHVLEGSVRKAGNRIRITAQLIRAENGYHLWSKTWDRTLDDIFAVQDEIAAEVVQQLKLTLLNTSPTVVETNPEAYALYLQARHLARMQTAAAYEQALALLEQVLAIAPDYAPAWAERAVVFNRQASYGLAPCDIGAGRAREAAARALAIDPRCALAHAEIGYAAISRDRDFAAAAHHLLTALAIDPDDPDLFSRAAKMATNMGRLDTARKLYDYLVERDPVNPAIRFDLGYLHHCNGDPDAALEQWQTALRLSPEQIGTRMTIAIALLLKGETGAALASADLEQNVFYRLLGHALIYFRMGRKAEADNALAELIADHQLGGAYNIALLLAWRGEMDLAFDWLEKALEHNDSGLPEISIEPFAESLRKDPRWEGFATRAGLSRRQLDAIEFDVKPPQ
ncbi:MAG: tetratricopeptide repeat protein [Halieaceae bacterium]|jgi:TolB-like protein|nr:tetratricopeptide repeat protein [Halieaceae bacterium]